MIIAEVQWYLMKENEKSKLYLICNADGQLNYLKISELTNYKTCMKDQHNHDKLRLALGP